MKTQKNNCCQTLQRIIILRLFLRLLPNAANKCISVNEDSEWLLFKDCFCMKWSGGVR